MIDKINFYDLYGYLIPGFVLIALISLPFSWLGGSWPSVDLDSAVAILILSYVTGFVLQSVATNVLPSDVRLKGASARKYPSDSVLDTADGRLSSTLKDNLTVIIKEQFGFDITDPKTRGDAFRACRAALIGKKVAGYAEQAQGMYSLARGLFSAVFLCVPFFLGWVASGFRDELVGLHMWWIGSVAVAILALAVSAPSWRALWKVVVPISVGLLVSTLLLRQYFFSEDNRRAIWLALPFLMPIVIALSQRHWVQSSRGRWAFGVSIGLAMLATGFDCPGKNISFDGALKMLGVSIIGVLVLLTLFSAYRRFGELFAVTTYRDFYSMMKLPPASARD